MIKDTYLVNKSDGHNKYYIVKCVKVNAERYECTYGGFGKSPAMAEYTGDSTVQKKIQEKLKKGYEQVSKWEFEFIKTQS